MIKKWNDIPDFMRIHEVKPYWELLYKKRFSLFLKRIFDLIASFVLIVFFAVPMIVIAIIIKIDSKGPVFYRQERVTLYGKHFFIHKFRTMVCNADQIGSVVTLNNDSRITRIGDKLRNYRLDEIPQLFDVICGNMSFVGTRPEAVKYVELYKPEFYATLLMPAGITSEASIHYKDEATLLNNAINVDRVYVEEILPEKMKWNLESLREFRLSSEIKTMFRTFVAVFGKKNNGSI